MEIVTCFNTFGITYGTEEAYISSLDGSPPPPPARALSRPRPFCFMHLVFVSLNACFAFLAVFINQIVGPLLRRLLAVRRGDSTGGDSAKSGLCTVRPLQFRHRATVAARECVLQHHALHQLQGLGGYECAYGESQSSALRYSLQRIYPTVTF